MESNLEILNNKLFSLDHIIQKSHTHSNSEFSILLCMVNEPGDKSEQRHIPCIEITRLV